MLEAKAKNGDTITSDLTLKKKGNKDDKHGNKHGIAVEMRL